MGDTFISIAIFLCFIISVLKLLSVSSNKCIFVLLY
nr:MAG TPA: hypothetical protein [Caudoviricetes sp.]